MKRIVIDTDTASDDAVAILMALRHPDVQVEAITMVSGNVPVKQATRNACITAELCDADVPVYMGATRPLLREPFHAQFFHGADGLGGVELPEPKKQPESAYAVEALIDIFRDNPKQIELVTLGPLTNIGLALRQEPELAGWIKHCTVMGGAACTVGNITPAAEYNIWCDPEAANIVFHSGIPISMVGWELCRGEANLLDEDMDYIRSLGTKYADFALDINMTALKVNRDWLGDPGMGLPDPVAMAVAIDPEICTRSQQCYVDVEIHSDLTRGMTVVDQLGVLKKEPNVRVCWEIDVQKWKELLYRCLT